MNGRGNKPADIIVPEILAEILKEQRRMNKVLSGIDSKPVNVSNYESTNDDLTTEQKKTNELLRVLVENVSEKATEKDNRPILEKLKDLADDGIINKSNKKVKSGRKKTKK